MFATYGDTIEYLDENLPELVGGRERVTVIGGRELPTSARGCSRASLRKTVVGPDYVPPDGEVDLLLSTDVALGGPEPPAGAGGRSRTTCRGTRSGSCSATAA